MAMEWKEVAHGDEWTEYDIGGQRVFYTSCGPNPGYYLKPSDTYLGYDQATAERNLREGKRAYWQSSK